MYKSDKLTIAVKLLQDLLDCTELNLDDLEPATVELLQEARDFLNSVDNSTE